MGRVPHTAGSMSVSDDFQRATLTWRDYRGDAWMYKVVRTD